MYSEASKGAQVYVEDARPARIIPEYLFQEPPGMFRTTPEFYRWRPMIELETRPVEYGGVAVLKHLESISSTEIGDAFKDRLGILLSNCVTVPLVMLPMM